MARIAGKSHPTGNRIFRHSTPRYRLDDGVKKGAGKKTMGKSADYDYHRDVRIAISPVKR